MNWPSEYRNFAHFTEYEWVSRVQTLLALYWKKTVGRNPKICVFSAEDGGQGPETSFYLTNTRRSAESRNLIILHWTRDGWQSPKTSCLHSTRTGDQSEETLNPLLNTRRWSESRTLAFFTEQKIMDLVQETSPLTIAHNTQLDILTTKLQTDVLLCSLHFG
jgi:hypothetical protein